MHIYTYICIQCFHNGQRTSKRVPCGSMIDYLTSPVNVNHNMIFDTRIHASLAECVHGLMHHRPSSAPSLIHIHHDAHARALHPSPHIHSHLCPPHASPIPSPIPSHPTPAHSESHQPQPPAYPSRRSATHHHTSIRHGPHSIHARACLHPPVTAPSHPLTPASRSPQHAPYVNPASLIASASRSYPPSLMPSQRAPPSLAAASSRPHSPASPRPCCLSSLNSPSYTLPLAYLSTPAPSTRIHAPLAKAKPPRPPAQSPPTHGLLVRAPPRDRVREGPL